MPRRIEDRDVVAWIVETPFGSDAGRSPEPGGAADSQRADHRPRRRPRSALQDSPGNRSHSVGSLRGRRGWRCVLRVRPRGLRGIRRRALRRRMRTHPDLVFRAIAAPSAASGAVRSGSARAIEARGFGAVIFTSGFRPDYTGGSGSRMRSTRWASLGRRTVPAR